VATPVEAPKLGNSVEECLISRWVKHKGEKVTAGDVVAEIETDKATFEVTSPVDGILLESFFDEGALVPVFTNIFVIGAEGESAETYRPGAQTDSPATPTPAPEPPAQTATPAPEPPAQTATTPDRAATVRERSVLSPRARRFADQNNFHPSTVAGSGPGGRILEADLKALFQSGTRLSKVRERIARRMRESLASTAQYTLNASADARGLLAIRARTKAVNLNHLVTFCAVEALLDVPSLNAEFIDGAIREHADVHIGFAADTPRGLLVPVVRNAHLLAVDELAERMKELGAKAAEGTIAPDDLSGATFTVSNLGALGIETFTPLLNPPQVAILGVGAIQVKPVRRGSQVEFIDAISLSLTCDHQIVDGAPGARFLQVLKSKIEDVESLAGL
jgi:pyruvate dehydrogenase E2 component (dihydrolipoamide acetyltransferase)